MTDETTAARVAEPMSRIRRVPLGAITYNKTESGKIVAVYAEELNTLEAELSSLSETTLLMIIDDLRAVIAERDKEIERLRWEIDDLNGEHEMKCPSCHQLLRVQSLNWGQGLSVDQQTWVCGNCGWVVDDTAIRAHEARIAVMRPPEREAVPDER